MKREELQDTIEKAVIACDGFTHTDIAEYIVSVIHHIGMQPPVIVNPDLKGKYSDFYEFLSESNYPNCVDYRKKYYVNEWEE